MARLTKKYRKSIRINDVLHQERFFTKKAADDWYVDMQKKKERIEAGIPISIDITKVTVEEQVRNVLARKQKINTKGTLSVDWPRYRDYILPIAAKKKLNFMSAADWEKILDYIQEDPETVVNIGRKENERKVLRIKRLSNTTRNHIRKLINLLYEDAIKIDKVSLINPISAVPRLSEGSAHERTELWGSREEGIKYLSAARDVSAQFYLWAIISMNWGNRMSEILGLQWRDVSRDRGVITVSKQFSKSERVMVNRLKEDRHGKDRKIKFIAINEPISSALLEAWEHTPFKTPESYLIHQEKADRPIWHGVIHAIHVRVCMSAKVKVIPPKNLRHYFASNFMMSGGNLDALRAILNHSSIKTTERYRHYSPEYLKNQANVMNISANLDTDNIRQLSIKNKS